MMFAVRGFYSVRSIEHKSKIKATSSPHPPKNCKQLFMYMNNWEKGVAPTICFCIFGTGEYSISAGAIPLDLIRDGKMYKRVSNACVNFF